jgi:hypothetical protein
MKRTFAIAAIIAAFVITAAAQAKQPKTVRDYFMALPDKYFSLDCCMSLPRSKRKAAYLKTYLEIEDNANGFMRAGGDGAQEAFEMALFKRPDGSYLIAFYTEGEGGVGDTPWTVFLNYKAGRWTDISRSVAPNYNKHKFIYVLPRKGTTVQVFAAEENADGYKGKKLYNLRWKNGKFVRSK